MSFIGSLLLRRRAATALPARAISRPLLPRLHRAFSTTPRVNEIIKKYTKDHEWIALDTDDSTATATVGITAHAAESLGDVVFVELPAVDTPVAAGDVFGAVESVKSASDLLSPAAGRVVQVNEALCDRPSLINRSPEADGWIAKLAVDGGAAGLASTPELMAEHEYRSFLAS